MLIGKASAANHHGAQGRVSVLSAMPCTSLQQSRSSGQAASEASLTPAHTPFLTITTHQLCVTTLLLLLPRRSAAPAGAYHISTGAEVGAFAARTYPASSTLETVKVQPTPRVLGSAADLNATTPLGAAVVVEVAYGHPGLAHHHITQGAGVGTWLATSV